MSEVQPGIHQINTPLGDRDNFVYVFVGEDAVLVFDVGCDGAPSDQISPYLCSIGVEADRVSWVFASHCDVDHFGGLASAREVFPRARLGAHTLDAPMMEDFALFEAQRGDQFVDAHQITTSAEDLEWMRSVTRVTALDVHVAGGERVRLSSDWHVEIRHVPGHSRGHLAVWDPRSHSYVISDAVLSDAVLLSDGTPAFPPTYRHVTAYRATIAAIGSSDFAAIFSAHYPDMDMASGREFLGTTRAFVERTEAAVIRALQDGPRTAQEIITTLNPDLGRWPAEGTESALAFPVVGHLEDLHAARQLKVAGSKGRATQWQLA